MEKLQNLEKCIFCCFAGGPQRYPTLSVLISDPRKIAKPGKKYFLLFCGRAKTWKNGKTWKNAFFAALLEGPNAIQRYPSLSALSQTLEKLQNLENAFFTILRDVAKPLKNCKTCNHTFFSGFREGPIQRYPSLSQTLEKMQNLEKIIFCCFAGGRKTLEKLQNLEKSIFCWFPGRLQHYPTLSVLISDPRKIAKPGKMHFLLLCGRAPTLSNAIQRYPSLSQTLEKLQNLEKCIFCWFPGRPQRYPTLSVLIPDPRKIAKPGKMHFLLVRRRAKTGKNCKTWKNAFFAASREGPNAIRHYPRP